MDICLYHLFFHTYNICVNERGITMCPLGTFAHTVRFRETLWVIARKYNTTVNAILAVNPGIDPYNLRIGQIICIPMANNFFR